MLLNRYLKRALSFLLLICFFSTSTYWSTGAQFAPTHSPSTEYLAPTRTIDLSPNLSDHGISPTSLEIPNQVTGPSYAVGTLDPISATLLLSSSFNFLNLAVIDWTELFFLLSSGVLWTISFALVNIFIFSLFKEFTSKKKLNHISTAFVLFGLLMFSLGIAFSNIPLYGAIPVLIGAGIGRRISDKLILKYYLKSTLSETDPVTFDRKLKYLLHLQPTIKDVLSLPGLESVVPHKPKKENAPIKRKKRDALYSANPFGMGDYKISDFMVPSSERIRRIVMGIDRQNPKKETMQITAALKRVKKEEDLQRILNALLILRTADDDLIDLDEGRGTALANALAQAIKSLDSINDQTLLKVFDFISYTDLGSLQSESASLGKVLAKLTPIPKYPKNLSSDFIKAIARVAPENSLTIELAFPFMIVLMEEQDPEIQLRFLNKIELYNGTLWQVMRNKALVLEDEAFLLKIAQAYFNGELRRRQQTEDHPPGVFLKKPNQTTAAVIKKIFEGMDLFSSEIAHILIHSKTPMFRGELVSLLNQDKPSQEHPDGLFGEAKLRFASWYIQNYKPLHSVISSMLPSTSSSLSYYFEVSRESARKVLYESIKRALKEKRGHQIEETESILGVAKSLGTVWAQEAEHIKTMLDSESERLKEYELIEEQGSLSSSRSSKLLVGGRFVPMPYASPFIKLFSKLSEGVPIKEAMAEVDKWLPSSANKEKQEDSSVAEGEDQPSAPLTQDASLEVSVGGSVTAPVQSAKRRSDAENSLADSYGAVIETLQGEGLASLRQAKAELKDTLGLVGQTLGKFTINEVIQVGGMGIVYAAVHPEHGAVALKVTNEGRFKTRFGFEVDALQKLDHPNIVRVHSGLQEQGPYTFYAMELAPVSLDEILAIGKPQLEATKRTLLKLAEALDYTHRQGMVHRDVKPANILFGEDGKPLLADFGLVKEADRDDVTIPGTFVGTPHYAAPEQLLGDQVDVRADIYSLGVLLYEMVTGKPLIPKNKSQAATARFQDKKVEGKLKEDIDRAEGTEKAMLEVVDKAVNFEKKDRHLTAKEFGAAVEAVEIEKPAASAKPTEVEEPLQQVEEPEAEPAPAQPKAPPMNSQEVWKHLWKLCQPEIGNTDLSNFIDGGLIGVLMRDDNEPLVQKLIRNVEFKRISDNFRKNLRQKWEMLGLLKAFGPHGVVFEFVSQLLGEEVPKESPAQAVTIPRPRPLPQIAATSQMIDLITETIPEDLEIPPAADEGISKEEEAEPVSAPKEPKEDFIIRLAQRFDVSEEVVRGFYVEEEAKARREGREFRQVEVHVKVVQHKGASVSLDREQEVRFKGDEDFELGAIGRGKPLKRIFQGIFPKEVETTITQLATVVKIKEAFLWLIRHRDNPAIRNALNQSYDAVIHHFLAEDQIESDEDYLIGFHLQSQENKHIWLAPDFISFLMELIGHELHDEKGQLILLDVTGRTRVNRLDVDLWIREYFFHEFSCKCSVSEGIEGYQRKHKRIYEDIQHNELKDLFGEQNLLKHAIRLFINKIVASKKSSRRLPLPQHSVSAAAAIGTSL